MGPRRRHSVTDPRVWSFNRLSWTGKQIAVEPPSVVFCVDWDALEPAEPVRRYDRENPGELSVASVRLGTASHHWAISRRSESSPWHRLGVRPRLHRRQSATW
jgi:hypothetical protein